MMCESGEGEKMGYTSFGQVMIRGNCPLRSLCPFTMASMILGWSDPRFTKQWLTPALHSASKKADDAVYIVTCCRVSLPFYTFNSGLVCSGSRSGIQGGCVVPENCVMEEVERGSSGLRGTR